MTPPACIPISTVVGLVLCAPCALAHDGDPDPRFGTGGKVFAPYSDGTNAYLISEYGVDLARQSGGRLLLVASSVGNASKGNLDFGVLGLQRDGTPDTSFGTLGTGSSLVDFNVIGSDSRDQVTGVAVQDDDKIVLAGIVDGDPSTAEDIGVARLNANGVPDSGFGNGGKAIVPFNLGDCANGGCSDAALRVDLQSDGKILLVGQATANPDATTGVSMLALARLTTSGQRDTTFDSDGRVTVRFGSGNAAVGYRARQLSDGAHIVAVGGANTSNGGSNIDFALVRLDANGALDPTFGTGGKTTYGFDIGGGRGDLATDFAELADGKILVCGEVEVNAPGNYDFGCMRFLVDGSPDPAFARVLIAFDRGGSFYDAPLRLESDGHGRFVLAGFSERSSENLDFAVARLDADGLLDSTFGQGGVATFNSLPGSGASERNNSAGGLVIAPNGSIIVGGYAEIDSAHDAMFEAVRLLGDDIFANGFEVLP